MEGLSLSVNCFLEFNNFRVLDSFGSISRKEAEKKAVSIIKKNHPYLHRLHNIHTVL